MFVIHLVSATCMYVRPLYLTMYIHAQQLKKIGSLQLT